MTAMKTLNKIFSASAVVLALLAQGCVSESPFGEKGEGTLRLSAELRGDITSVATRAADYDQTALEDNLVVYIQKENVGVVRKFLGLASLQGADVALQTGHYVLEGWTGDSVSASFDKKFYYGYLPVDVKEGNNAVSLKCDIANVLTSVNSELVADRVSDVTLEVGHTRGSLTFDSEMISSDPKGEKKGYFMMPNGVTDLYYKLSGKNSDGTSFSKEGEINGVLRAHDYQFILKADASQVTQGGALVKVEIVEVPVIDEEVTVFPAPTFKATSGEELLDLERQIDLTQGEYSDIKLRILAYKGMSSLRLSFSSNFPAIGGVTGLDVIADGRSLLPDEIMTEMIETEDNVASADNEMVNATEYWLTFPVSYLRSLPISSEEYTITFDVTDGRGYSSQQRLRWANSEEAVERLAPVGSYSKEELLDYTAITPNSAILYGAVYDDSVADFGIRIREAGQDTWTSLPGSLTKASAGVTRFSVKAAGLKASTKYEYKAYADDFEEEEIRSFTTESVFEIPNASFEDWSTYSASTILGTKNVILPWSVGDKEASFWGSGNEGGATANKVLTNKSEDMVHSGQYSARLGSDEAMGIIAAGNIFTGYYVKTDGTNGVLSVGAPYNGSHPSALRVFANYRPGGKVKIKNSPGEDILDGLTEGGTDQGQIYVALTTEPYEIRTNPKNRRLFEKNDASVVAYGQVTWKEAFGPDGELNEVNIPLEYKANAKTLRPTHLVIVCSASKFGDYFCGSSSSVMYLDDFQLVYE